MYYILCYITPVLMALSGMGSDVKTTTQGSYTCYQVADSCRIETYEYEQDSILVIETVCAPICSSIARVYNKEWLLLHECSAPQGAIFPLAQTDSTGVIYWSDNTIELLDEEELKARGASSSK